jgi:hypothetical protein
MPFKFESQKLLIPRNLNKNVKISLEEREEIKKLYGIISQRKLAKMYGVSRRLIIFIGDEEKARINKMRGKENRLKYYTKEKQRVYIKKTRDHKKELNKKGLLKKNTKV